MQRLIPQFVKIEIPGGEYLLHTSPPFVVGKISKFKNEIDLINHLEQLRPFVYKILDNYNICISLWTILVAEPDKKIIQEVVNNMAEHYKMVTINKSLKYYDKFKS